MAKFLPSISYIHSVKIITDNKMCSYLHRPLQLILQVSVCLTLNWTFATVAMYLSAEFYCISLNI